MRGNPTAEKLGAMLRLTDREGALKKITAALDKAGGSIQGAADELGIAKRTLFLWASEYEEISKAIKRARNKRSKAAREES